MNCLNCLKRMMPFYICMRTGKSRQIIEKETELTGCNIDGYIGDRWVGLPK
jgi:hypothetical protein